MFPIVSINGEAPPTPKAASLVLALPCLAAGVSLAILGAQGWAASIDGEVLIVTGAIISVAG